MLGPVVATLRSSIEELQVTVRGLESADVSWSETREALLELERLRERFDHAVGSLLSDCSVRGGHARDGAHSMANWVTQRTGQRRAVAGSRMFLATKLRSMPATGSAVEAGEITASHAQVLTRALNPRTVDVFARDEGLLVASARKLTADQLVQVVEFWLRHNDPDGADPGDVVRADVFHLSQTLDGRLKGDFDLGGDLAVRAKAIIDEAVSQVMARDRKARDVDPTDPRAGETSARRRARALGELLERAASSDGNPARRQPLFNLHTTVDTLTGEGGPADWLAEVEMQWRSALPARLLDQWSCDCHVGRIILDAEGVPLDVGRTRRLATSAQRRALAARDGGCAVPGCDRPPGWCEAHHIVPWSQGGATTIDNLVLGCSWHHHRVHAGDLVVEMIAGRPQFSLPDGQILAEPRAGPDTSAA